VSRNENFKRIFGIFQEMIGSQWKSVAIVNVGVESASSLPVSIYRQHLHADYVFITQHACV